MSTGFVCIECGSQQAKRPRIAAGLFVGFAPNALFAERVTSILNWMAKPAIDFIPPSSDLGGGPGMVLGDGL